jgi:hypothetical protein
LMRWKSSITAAKILVFDFWRTRDRESTMSAPSL